MPLHVKEKQQAEAKKLIDKGLVGEILFWETTYQVEVKEGKHTYWPLLQISDCGKLLDALCSCQLAEDSLCPHSVAGYLTVLNSQGIPLHVRFRESLWYQIAEISSRRHGYTPECGEVALATFTTFSQSGKKIFSLTAKTEEGKKQFRKIFLEKIEKNENNSLEFSNRSPEEMRLWREGKPSHEMQFSLSFWCDVAKWLMKLQEKSLKKSVDFFEQKEGLPKGLKADFTDVEIQFFIAEANWERIIPTLKSVSSSLKVFDEERLFSFGLHYNVEQRAIFVTQDVKETKRPSQEIPIGNWIYVAKEGFYPAHVDPLFKKEIIPTEHLPFLLSYRRSILEKKLDNAKIFKEKIEAKYSLSFDANHTLHIRLFVFEEGDMAQERAALFENWAYVPNRGFVELEKKQFDAIETVICKEKVSDFIAEHKNFLAHQKGFESHVSSLEAQLGFEWEGENLHFFRALDKSILTEDVIDLGEWVYVRTRGFFSKKASDTSALIHADLYVAGHEIASFVAKNKEELQGVKGFFAKSCPILSAGISVHLSDKEKIIVTPTYDLKEGYSLEEITFFGRFVYVKKEGFSELPKSAYLPLEFQKEKVIPPYEVKNFLLHTLKTLEQLSYIDPRLIKPYRLKLTVYALKKKNERGLWEFNLGFSSESGQTSLKPVWLAYKQHKPFAYTGAGLIDLSEGSHQWLSSLSEESFEEETLVLTSLDWYKIFIYEEPKISEELLANPEMKEWFEELSELITKESLDLKGFKSELRAYQEIGVKWLFSLYSLGFSGLLCDEMGLGKTHQAMGLIAAVRNSCVLKKIKVAIICPTSVIYHWEAQIKRYLPEQLIFVFYGTERSIRPFEEKGGILLTSYGILRSEQKTFIEQKFDLVIFDEIQVAKNPASKTHRVLRMLKAGMRLGLTGTPIENRLDELKALFDIVLPQYLPKKEAFTEQFVIPIEKEADAKAKQKLKELIKPFLLRRKKQEVLKELPEKIEEIAYCALSEEQKELYYAAIRRSKKGLLEELKVQGAKHSYLHIFALLTELKRICDHPSLITKNPQGQSGKWELFIELLSEAKESGQKVVVFSQYLEMLDIIEEYLKKNRIGYAAVRGSTHNRREEIRKFQEDPGIDVFVASLQAVGVGVDLTAGSVVIHYDRWWNPAKENQATDRVHRIGQNRGVQVFKMVTKGTIEERIHALIEKKKGLSSEVLPHDDEEEIRSLSKEELVQLLLSLEEKTP